MIRVENLSKTFTYYHKEEGLKGSIKNLFAREKLEKEAVKLLSFHIEKGEIVGFIGPNGAGKTTTLKMLSGILYPTSGTIQVGGYIPWAREKSYKMMFALVMGQKSQLWWDLPATDSLLLNKEIYEIEEKQYRQTVNELVDLLCLKEFMKVQVRRLSLGERMKFELIAALLHRPQIIFLDEPTIGLDLISQKNIRSFLAEYNRKYNATILLTSHYVRDLEELCDRTILIDKGEMVYSGLLTGLNEFLGVQHMIRFSGEAAAEKYALALHREIARDQDSFLCYVSEDDANPVMKQLLERDDVRGVSLEGISLEDAISMAYSGKREVVE